MTSPAPPSPPQPNCKPSAELLPYRVGVNGQPAGTVEIPLVMMMIFSVGTSIGYNHGSAVSDRYKAPFAFGGTPAVQQARAAAEMSRQ